MFSETSLNDYSSFAYCITALACRSCQVPNVLSCPYFFSFFFYWFMTILWLSIRQTYHTCTCFLTCFFAKFCICFFLDISIICFFVVYVSWCIFGLACASRLMLVCQLLFANIICSETKLRVVRFFREPNLSAFSAHVPKRKYNETLL